MKVVAIALNLFVIALSVLVNYDKMGVGSYCFVYWIGVRRPEYRIKLYSSHTLFFYKPKEGTTGTSFAL